MENFFLFLFVATCGGLLLWGMGRRERIYEYPFLVGAIFTSFFIPQALSLVNDPGTVSIEFVNRALLMGTLCMLMAWAGYSLKPLRRISEGPVRSLDNRKITFAALATAGISLMATWEMSRIPQELQEASTGPFTIMVFFASFSIISFPILFAQFLDKITLKSTVIMMLSGAPMYIPMIFAGRRAASAAFLLIIGLMLYFRKRLTPGRILALSIVILVAFLIPIFAAMRQNFWTDLFHGRFDSIPFEWDKLLNGKVLELRNAAAMIEGTIFTGDYGYGTGFWDALVFRYVPGQLVGFDLKDSLQFKWNSEPWHAIGYTFSTGSTYTAIGDSFQQFGYFGAFIFFFQGYLFKNIWFLAARRNSLIAQTAYVALIPIALVGVTMASVWFVQGGAIVWLLLYMFYRYARLPIRRARPEVRAREADLHLPGRPFDGSSFDRAWRGDHVHKALDENRNTL